jgi:hypothetical protein
MGLTDRIAQAELGNWVFFGPITITITITA